MNKKLITLIAIGAVIIGIVLFFRAGNTGITSLNLPSEGVWFPLLVVVAALIDSINPCAISILLLTIAFLLSIGKIRSSILTIGGFYILGIFIVYILIGLGILQTLNFFNVPHFMARAGASLLILIGIIDILGQRFPSFPIKFGIPQAAHNKIGKLMEKASLPTAFLLGALVGLYEFPCTGGPYLMILGMLHDQGTYFSGLGYLVLYNLVFVLPLVVILLIASNNALIEKVRSWKKAETKHMRTWGGIAMILLGIIIFLL